MGKDEEKVEVLNAFFTSVFNSKISCSPGSRLWNWSYREWNEIPVIQGEMVGDLLHNLHTLKSMGLHGIHLRVVRELLEVLTKPLQKLSAALAKQRGLR